jgi:hypothetical protein
MRKLCGAPKLADRQLRLPARESDTKETAPIVSGRIPGIKGAVNALSLRLASRDAGANKSIGCGVV